MIEILLIVFSLIISSRFKQAGQKGAKKYILGIWMTYLGALVLAGMIGGIAESVGGDSAMLGAIYPILIIGYIIEIVVACKGMSHSKRLLLEIQTQNSNVDYQYQQGLSQPQPNLPQYTPVKQQGWEQQPPPQNISATQYATAQQGIYGAPIYCANCATPLAEGARFCISCGIPVVAMPAQTIPQVQAAVPQETALVVPAAPAILKKASAWLFLIPLATAIIGGILLFTSISQFIINRDPSRLFDLTGEVTFSKAGNYYICSEGSKSEALLVHKFTNKATGEELSSVLISTDRRVEVRAPGRHVLGQYQPGKMITSFASIDIESPGTYKVSVSGIFDGSSGLRDFAVYEPFSSPGQSIVGIVFGGIFLVLTLFILALIAERRLSPAVPKSRKAALVLAIIPHTGFFGIDRFYLGHYTMGLLKFFTGGGLLVLYIIDIYRIATRTMKDRRGNQLR